MYRGNEPTNLVKTFSDNLEVSYDAVFNGVEYQIFLTQSEFNELRKVVPPTVINGNRPAFDFDKVQGSLELRYFTEVPAHTHKQACVFDSTEKFCKNILGVNLSQSDKAWFLNRSDVGSSGVGPYHAPNIIHHAIKPYGLGVQKIYMKKGVMNPMDERVIAALGMNPIAKIDGLTSNHEMPVGMQGGPFNVEYIDSFDGPAIKMGDFELTTFASGGGHATYRAPREPLGNWEVAIIIARLEQCVYHAPWPDEPPQEDVKTTLKISLAQSKINDKALIDIIGRKPKQTFYQGSKYNYRSGNYSIEDYYKSHLESSFQLGLSGVADEFEDIPEVYEYAEDFGEYPNDADILNELEVPYRANFLDNRQPVDLLDLDGLISFLTTAYLEAQALWAADLFSLKESLKDLKEARRDKVGMEKFNEKFEEVARLYSKALPYLKDRHRF